MRFIEQHGLNEFFEGDADDIGIVMQGGMYNTALRALEVLGLADVFGRSRMIVIGASLMAVGHFMLAF